MATRNKTGRSPAARPATAPPPRAEAHPKEPLPATAGTAAPGVTRVAIVDDHPMVRDGLRGQVERCPGFTVVLEAENGEDYEGQCKGRPAPDITLVDLHMPVRDGWLTLRWMKEHQPGTKGIAFSFDLTEEGAWRAAEYGARALMSKNEGIKAWHAALVDVRDEGDHLNAAMRQALRYRPEKDSPAALQKRVEETLAPRELRFLLAYLEDNEPTLQQLATRWKVELSTVESWRRRVVEKLGVSKRLALFKCALRFHLVKWAGHTRAGSALGTEGLPPQGN